MFSLNWYNFKDAVCPFLLSFNIAPNILVLNSHYVPLSLLFSHSLTSDSLRPHGLQLARLPCPSPTLGDCSNSHPSSWWCHPAISSSSKHRVHQTSRPLFQRVHLLGPKYVLSLDHCITWKVNLLSYGYAITREPVFYYLWTVKPYFFLLFSYHFCCSLFIDTLA